MNFEPIAANVKAFFRNHLRSLRARSILIAAILMFLSPLFLWQQCGLNGCPNVDRLQSYQPGRESKLVDRNGVRIALLRPVEGSTTPLKNIPERVRNAFVAVEDKRFYEHSGVDWWRLLGALVANLKKGSVNQGFSTITMQLARNVFPDRLPANERTLKRKLMEIRVAKDIEGRFTKKEILELYLSHIYFGNGARGISAAASHYFGKPVHRLSLSEGALLAALLKGPALYDPRRHPDAATKRRNLVLDLMLKNEKASETEITQAKKQPLGVIRKHAADEKSEQALAPYFTEEVRRQLDDQFGERLFEETLTVTTTLDLQMQTAAEEALQNQLQSIESGSLGTITRGEELQGAIVTLQAATGDVLVWVGGKNFRESRFDRVKLAHRQTGSAFKPFVYAAALNKGHVLSEYLEDKPVRIEIQKNRYWEPKNFDNEMDGRVTMRDALVRSKNIPTVLLGEDTGLDEIIDLAEDAGIESDIEATPALPLGTPAVSPLELATAYTPFATLGKAVKPRLILRIEDADGKDVWTAPKPEPEEVLDEGIAYLITNVLQEALEIGTGAVVRRLGFTKPAAGKTGTTNDATDVWFVGYTPEVVSVVWMGFDQPRTIMDDATGGRIAAPVWARFMQRSSFVQSTSREWNAPNTITQRWVDPSNGMLLQEGCSPVGRWAYTELFIKDKIKDTVCPRRGQNIAMQRTLPTLEEDGVRDLHLFPEEYGRSQPAPAPAFEEAEPERKSTRVEPPHQKKQRHKRARGRNPFKKLFDRIRRH